MKQNTTFLSFLMNQKNWWAPFLIIFVISITGLIFIGYQTYEEAPPIPDFKDTKGNIIISKDEIIKGQEVFHRYALMEYGSMFGDGALRGPDFTAQALNQVARKMNEHYEETSKASEKNSAFEIAGIASKVQQDIKLNTYNKSTNSVILNEAQVYAVKSLIHYYGQMFTDHNFSEAFKPANYISNKEEITDLSMFFFWGAWVCGVQRPGEIYSYTHNWPYDPLAGNVATSSTLIWSIIGLLGLVIGLGAVMYFYGQFEKLNENSYSKGASEMITEDKLKSFIPSATQRATYKFFFVAILIFLVQVLAGILTVHDFVNFTTILGLDLQQIFPITITRSWHLQLSLFWISACWIGISFFILPFLVKKEPKGQLFLINSLFWTFFIMVAGSSMGIYFGPKGSLGDFSRWLGHQGWEFIEMGRLYQYFLLVIFVLWAIIVYRGVKSELKPQMPWALPNWLIYSIGAILLLLFSGFIAKPETNFVVADFWRWMVVHMWVEAFFEVFTTIIVGYIMVMMGLVNKQSVVKVVYLGALLFLGSGLLGISHNFYWNAKPVGTLALGSVFSTLQVVPLILLSLEAWKMQRMPYQLSAKGDKSSLFAMPGVFLFILGVTFWNFFGAGVFGLIINLPIVNYYEHGTYLTVNHGHAALMGVYGNLSIAALLFCLRFLIKPDGWNTPLIKTAFWSINIGLALMVLLDLLPAGIHQLVVVLEKGYWFARSQEFIQGIPFQTMTWFRIVGGSIFCLGGVFPLTWFVLKNVVNLKDKQTHQFDAERKVEKEENKLEAV